MFGDLRLELEDLWLGFRNKRASGINVGSPKNKAGQLQFHRFGKHASVTFNKQVPLPFLVTRQRGIRHQVKVLVAVVAADPHCKVLFWVPSKGRRTRGPFFGGAFETESPKDTTGPFWGGICKKALPQNGIQRPPRPKAPAPFAQWWRDPSVSAFLVQPSSRTPLHKGAGPCARPRPAAKGQNKRPPNKKEVSPRVQ